MNVVARGGLVVLCALLGAGIGCGSDALEIGATTPVAHTVSFVGYVYDGATGERLTGYGLTILERDVAHDATVAEDGRYQASDLGVWDDLSVTIAAEGYRPFVSHNARVGLPEGVTGQAVGEVSTAQTLHFDAYLFPDDLVTGAVSLNVQTPVAGEAPSGQLRLRPTTPSMLADQGVETPAGVPGQLWENDEDFQANTLSKSFSQGILAIPAGSLVYGVTYQVDIWDVPGYQPLLGSYQAGVESDKTFLLTEMVHAPVALVTSTHEFCETAASPSDTAAASVTIVLNQAIEEAATPYPGGNVEALDDGLSISSPDFDTDLARNTLRPDASPDLRERGVALAIVGDTIEIHWSAAAGLATSDPDDPIESVTYTGLSNVLVQRPGIPSSAVSLAELLGTASFTCQ